MSSKRGTYYEIEQLRKRVEELENTLKKFLDNWGPDVQKKRDERDVDDWFFHHSYSHSIIIL